MENKPLLDELRVALEAELAAIHSLSEGGGEARATVTLNQQSVGRLSRMDAMLGQAMAQAAERHRRQRSV
tara:strand:- start:37735 stop:37944 length:210 start_codon:yes stop_codon:yes gene_type:complete